MSRGDKKAPMTLPRRTDTTAAASSPPAARVMTTLEAMVVGRQAVASMPMMTGTEGVPLSRAPAAREMCRIAVQFVSKTLYSYIELKRVRKEKDHT